MFRVRMRARVRYKVLVMFRACVKVRPKVYS